MKIYTFLTSVLVGCQWTDSLQSSYLTSSKSVPVAKETAAQVVNPHPYQSSRQSLSELSYSGS